MSLNNSILPFILISFAICSCTLETVVDKGQKCPGDNASENAILKYIGDLDCQQGDCDKYEELNGYCPAEFSECGYDVENHYYYCSKFVCKDTEHIYGNVCEKDTVENCGSHENNCIDKIAGWKTGHCISKKCEATECINGYEISNGKCQAKQSACEKDEHLLSNGECEKNSIEHCGSHGYSCQTQDGWVDGTCSSQGQCLASECAFNDGYVLNKDDQRCHLIHCNAGEHSFLDDCEANSLDHCGKHENSCSKQPGWLKGTCSDNGICEVSECQKGYQLVNHECIPLLQCASNSHFFETECEDNTLEHCQSHADDCTALTGWASGECQNGKCIIEKCQMGFCLSSDGYCILGESKDVACGTNGLACSVCSGATQCINGQCQ